MQWCRRAAEKGRAASCLRLAGTMYSDLPYAREVGHVREAAGPATSAGVMEGHDVPPEVLTSVIHWLRKGCVTGQHALSEELDGFRRVALEGGMYCDIETCEVMGHLKDFKVCPQCKSARYWAPRVKKRTGQRVGTRRSAANFDQSLISKRFIWRSHGTSHQPAHAFMRKRVARSQQQYSASRVQDDGDNLVLCI